MHEFPFFSLITNLAPCCVSMLASLRAWGHRREGSAKLVVFEHPNARERLLPLLASIQNRDCDPSAMVHRATERRCRRGINRRRARLMPSQLQFSLSSLETNVRLVFADGPLAAREQCGVNAPTSYRRLVLSTAVGAIALDRNHRFMSVPRARSAGAVQLALTDIGASFL